LQFGLGRPGKNLAGRIPAASGSVAVASVPSSTYLQQKQHFYEWNENLSGCDDRRPAGWPTTVATATIKSGEFEAKLSDLATTPTGHPKRTMGPCLHNAAHSTLFWSFYFHGRTTNGNIGIPSKTPS